LLRRIGGVGLVLEHARAKSLHRCPKLLEDEREDRAISICEAREERLELVFI
jgi:hypothetical protein